LVGFLFAFICVGAELGGLSHG